MGKMLNIKPRLRQASNNPSRAVFGYAYRRIWSGWAMSFWEILFWSALGLYFGFKVFNLVPYIVDYWLYLAAAVLIPGIIPMVIGGAIYKCHVNVGTADASLKALPLTPNQVIGPRMLASALTWFQYTVPLILIFLITQFEILASQPVPDPSVSVVFHDQLLDNVTRVLYLNAYTGKVFSLGLLAGHSNLPLFILGFTQLIGWGAAPLTWGFLWASYFQRRGGLFLLAYIAYFIFPVILFMIMVSGQQNLFGQFFTEFWVQAYVLGLGGVLISIVLFFLALRTWGRRAG